MLKIIEDQFKQSFSNTATVVCNHDKDDVPDSYTLYDENYVELIPTNYEETDDNTVTFTLAAPASGNAILIFKRQVIGKGKHEYELQVNTQGNGIKLKKIK